MKIAGWILLVMGCLGLLGCILGRIQPKNAGNYLLFIALGAYFIHNANQKKEDEEKKKQWKDGGQEGNVRK